MKKIIQYGFFILLINITGSVVVYGRQIQPPAGERVILFSDRTLYIAGEQILFSALIQTGNGTDQQALSRVLYCELITPDGKKIAGNKFLAENSVASGYLPIPDYIITGNYYLRAYTKFMRNEGPGSYHYTLLKIVNPNRSEVQADIENDNISESLSEEIMPANPVNSFQISTSRSQFSARDTVHIIIEDPDTVQSSIKVLTMAVVPEFSISAKLTKIPGNKQSDIKTYYYPESRGLSLTGKLTGNSTGNNLVNTRVNLSIIGKGCDFMATKTDSAGRFFFSLPDYTGSRDLFLNAENTGNINPKILADNDFCTIPFHIRSRGFTLTPEEREIAYKMAVNLQLESYFRIESVRDTGDYQCEDQAFYGKPSEILYIDNYVQLPTLEEYFNELPTLVKVRKHLDKKYFKILGPQTGLSEFDPLIMVDLVAIEDMSGILAITPANISRIEVVNSLYVKGDQIYGGIVNFISKNGDFAGINLPSSGIFINYGFLANRNPDLKVFSSSHSPDTRNTLCWKPQLLLNKNGSAKLYVMAPDTPGRYLVVLNGVNYGGEIFRKSVVFDVLKQQ